MSKIHDPVQQALSASSFLGRVRVIFIEDSISDAAILSRMIASESDDYTGIRVETREEMEQALSEHPCDIVLCDHDLPEFDVFGALEVLSEHALDIPLIIVTGSIGGEEAAVELMRNGATDYLPKHKLDRLIPAVKRVLDDARTRREKQQSDLAVVRKNRELKAALRNLKLTREQLGRAGRLKNLGQMAAGVAHDFNNALTKLIGVTAQIEQEEIASIALQIEHLKTITKDAASIVKRLRFSYQASSTAEATESVDINKVIQESIDLTRPRWGAERLATNAAIDVAFHPEEMPSIAGDTSQYREALTNLIFNACDALPEGGTISLSAVVTDRAVIVTINDTGEGMSEEVLLKCLDPFFTTKGEMGSGLGMALVNSMLEQFGGKMKVESELHVGTSIIMETPIFDEAADEVSDTTQTSRVALEPLKIMLVEDEPQVSQILTMFLEKDGHSVDSFDNGFDALEKLGEQSYDVVILDRALPEMRGDEIAKRISEMRGSEKIIMATGFGDFMIESAEMPEGVDFILPKPITREALQDAVSATFLALPA